jgi:hypothetical protein
VKRETGDADILSCGDHGLWTRPGGGVSSVRKNVVRGADRVSAASRALLDEVLGDHSERDDLVVVFSGVVIDPVYAWLGSWRRTATSSSTRSGSSGRATSRALSSW